MRERYNSLVHTANCIGFVTQRNTPPIEYGVISDRLLLEVRQADQGETDRSQDKQRAHEMRDNSYQSYQDRSPFNALSKPMIACSVVSISCVKSDLTLTVVGENQW